MVTSHSIYLIILTLAIIISYQILDNRLTLRFVWNTAKCYLVLYFTLFSIAYLLIPLNDIKVYKVALDSYSKVNLDHVRFNFENKKFQKQHTLTSYPEEIIKDDFTVVLYLREPIRHIYFIDKIKLEPKKTSPATARIPPPSCPDNADRPYGDEFGKCRRRRAPQITMVLARPESYFPKIL